MKARLAAAVALAVAGCTTGPRVRDYEPAQEPSGVRGELTLRDGRKLYVELLQLQDTAFLVQANSLVLVVPFRVLTTATFLQIGRVVWNCRGPNSDDWEQLRLASRFPYGVPNVALSALLGRAGQAAAENLGAVSEGERCR